MALYMPPRRRNRTGRRLVWLVVILAVAGFGGWFWKTHLQSKAPASPEPGSAKNDEGRGSEATPPEEINPRTTGPEKQTHTVGPKPTLKEISPRVRKQADTSYQRGMALLARNDPIEARRVLSEALLSGGLSGDAETRCVEELTRLADASVFSPRIYDGDPYAIQYVFQSGEVLQHVERKMKLHVPWQGLLLVNRMTSARKIRAGQALKLIQGPFHATVYKARHLMDLYLRRSDLPPVFVRRVKVGLGADGSTPLGSWKVVNKLVRGDYYPAANSRHKKPRIEYGEPGYAFGEKGLWIGLEGTDENTEGMQGYGIHSTDEPSSIGHDASEGCIRLSDQDIDFVYALLYEKWSTVEILP